MLISCHLVRLHVYYFYVIIETLASMNLSTEHKIIECIPPCQIIPYHRQVMFATPICFLHTKPDEAYFLFRALYCR